MPTGAMDQNFVIIGVDSSFHDCLPRGRSARSGLGTHSRVARPRNRRLDYANCLEDAKAVIPPPGNGVILDVTDRLHRVNAHPGARGGIGGDEGHREHHESDSDHYEPFNGLNLIKQ